jgi:hypothetical protein
MMLLRYTQATAVNTTDYKLLASEGVSVVCDNRYIGKSSLPQTIVPREIFDVYFGADPAIKVCTEHYSVCVSN